MQGRIGPDGPVALISLPCPVLCVTAEHRPGRGLSVHGSGQRLITPDRAHRFLASLGLELSGSIRLRAAMPAGGGAGASTASLLALARLANASQPPETLAQACIRSEGASDPLMFDRPERLLWASREGQVLRALPPLPRMEVIGGFLGPARRTDPKDATFPDIADLILPWEEAARAGDLGALANLSTVSARRTIALRGGPDDTSEYLMRDLGALGFVIAHTGSVRGYLFAPGRIPANARTLLRAAGIRGVVQFGVGGEGCPTRSSCS
jgi:uncharacterized protein involved in propanediol utilization